MEVKRSVNIKCSANVNIAVVSAFLRRIQSIDNTRVLLIATIIDVLAPDA